MKAVVIGESSGASMDAIMAVYPRHKVVVDKFIARGAVLGIGEIFIRASLGWGCARSRRRPINAD